MGQTERAERINTSSPWRLRRLSLPIKGGTGYAARTSFLTFLTACSRFSRER